MLSGTFTRKEISDLHELSVETLKYREKVLGIEPKFKKQKSKAMLYTFNHALNLISIFILFKLKLPYFY